jgi:hypothetical protein
VSHLYNGDLAITPDGEAAEVLGSSSIFGDATVSVRLLRDHSARQEFRPDQLRPVNLNPRYQGGQIRTSQCERAIEVGEPVVLLSRQTGRVCNYEAGAYVFQYEVELGSGERVWVRPNELVPLDKKGGS